MNLNALTTPMMLNLTAQWVENPVFRSTLSEASPLGYGVLTELDKVHAPLKALQNNRNETQVQQRELIDLTTELDIRHDSLARGLHYHLRGFIECAQDPATVQDYRRLLDLLFPTGLAVTRLPYIEESGSAIALEAAIKPAVRAKLAAIQVGEQRLLDLFDAWMAAARELGRVMQQRTELAAASTRDGSNGEWSDVKAGRMQWIRVVRGLLWVLDLEPKLATLRERVVAGLRRAIATANRRTNQAADVEGDAEGEASEGETETDDVEFDAADGVSEAEDDVDFGVDTIEAVEPVEPAAAE